MKKDSALTQNDFDALLGWLSADRNEAGALYEEIRDGLVRFFCFRGCSDPAALADETIDRAAQKLKTFDDAKGVKPITYFCGFATNIFFEYLRAPERRKVSWDSKEFSTARNFRTTDLPNVGDCLEDCLMKLPDEERTLVLGYYGEGKKMEKSEMRRKMAAAVNLTMPALHARVYRNRGILRECVKKCLGKK